jgi:signal transduction histidine kinase
MMRSLRIRAIVGGVLLSAFVVCLGSITLYLSLDRIALARFDDTLADRHARMVVALFDTGPNAEQLAQRLADPGYLQPYSGRYWQLNGPGGTVLTSPSLFDFALPVPDGTGTTRAIYNTPAGALRALALPVTMDDGTIWQVMIAESIERLEFERRQIRRSLGLTFATLVLGGLIGSILHVATVLRPLERLRQDILRRWENSETLAPRDYPSEVAPLVEDINALISRNHDIIERSRRQGADLAHALKTPSAVLRNELDGLGLSAPGAARARDALDRIDAQVKRSLARIRAGNVGNPFQAPTQIFAALRRLSRLFQGMPEHQRFEFHSKVDPHLTVAMDRQDLEEIIGNLLDNAYKWADRRVTVRAEQATEEIILHIEDDGPGIPEDLHAAALRSGQRLDSSRPGSGLGLAIVCDLVEAYGGRISLGRSASLGGLHVSLALPRTYRPQAMPGGGDPIATRTPPGASGK